MSAADRKILWTFWTERGTNIVVSQTTTPPAIEVAERSIVDRRVQGALGGSYLATLLAHSAIALECNGQIGFRPISAGQEITNYPIGPDGRLLTRSASIPDSGRGEAAVVLNPTGMPLDQLGQVAVTVAEHYAGE